MIIEAAAIPRINQENASSGTPDAYGITAKMAATMTETTYARRLTY